MLKKRNELDRDRCNSSCFKRGRGELIKGKKGQITVFIILGIILLLALVLVILLKKEVITFKPEKVIPTEKSKVENYLTACIRESGEQALFKVGLQAGYIEVPEDIAQDGNRQVRISPIHVVPYWSYGQNVFIPSLEEIKSRVDRYIEEKLEECLLEREVFRESYELIEKSGITADTEFADRKTLFKVHWNIEVQDKSGDVISELINHLAESPIKFKRVYQTAKTVMERELADLKLEEITQDLISLGHPRLPVSGMEVSCQKKTWKASEVKEALKNMLRINVRELKVKGTEFVEFPETLPYYGSHYIWDIGKLPPGISVVFNFNGNYPFLFYVTPQRGGILESGMQGGSGLISFFCLQIWKFTYDVTYPVLVRVRDETTDYNLQMAFTVHLVKNIPNRKTAEIRAPIHLAKTVTSEDYCEKMNVPMAVTTYELVENEETGVYSREPLEGVALSFTCLKYRCEMGDSEYDFGGRGHAAGLAADFPYCVGGILRGEKENYKESWQRVVTKQGEEVELDMVPLFKFPARGIKIVKHELMGQDQRGLPMFGAGQELSQETALIKLVNKKEGQEFQKITWATSPQLDPKIAEESELEFLGKANFGYEVEIHLFEGEEMKGGYKGNWTVPWSELENGREITFHVVSKEEIKDDTELVELFTGLEGYSKYIPLPEIR